MKGMAIKGAGEIKAQEGWACSGPWVTYIPAAARRLHRRLYSRSDLREHMVKCVGKRQADGVMAH